MPSPFPGMDPYIEDPEVWSDFHGRFAEHISADLNAVLADRYVARLAPRVTYDLVEVGERRSVRPDVGVWRSQPDAGLPGGGAAVLTTAPVESLVPMELPLRLYTVEVHETGTLRLVTSVEILSPAYKRPSHEAYDDYLRKRRRILRSEVHLIEIDFLRGGVRPPLELSVPPAPYYVTLSRGDQRPHAQVWPIQLGDELPRVPVPLLDPDPDVPLHLGSAVRTVYERGAYARMIDYGQPPPPPALTAAEAAWLDECLRAQKAR